MVKQMAGPIVSIIIPVYNVCRYLTQCVDSVLNQTYPRVEILLVDDGSTDGSGSLCDQLERRDGRITVIHKPNGGLSDARNAGTAACSGEYVFYLDSDDYLEPNAISELMELLTESGAQAAAGNYFYTYSDHESAAEPDTGNIALYTRKETISLLMQGKIQTFAWGKLLPADIARRHPFPVGKLFEDHFWTHLIFQDCERVAFTAKPLVHYRQREDSISYTYTLSRLDILEGWRVRIAFLQREYPELTEDYFRRCAKDSLGLAWLVLTRMKKNKKQGFAQIRQFSRDYALAELSTGTVRTLLLCLNRSDFAYACRALYYRIFGRTG